VAYNGSGVFNRVMDWTTDLANAIPVTAARMDQEDDGFAVGLSNSICRDGQSTTTARIPFAAGLSSIAGSTASVSYAQTNDLNTGLYFPGSDQWGLVAGGTATLTSTATALTATGTLALSGDFAVNTDKFTVASASGNTLVAGTLSVTGASALTGNLAINTDKFTVTAASGNTLVAGTLAVTGAATLSSTLAAGNTTITGTLAASGNVAINTDKFTVAAASGNTLVAGTLAVTGASTLTGALTANNAAGVTAKNTKKAYGYFTQAGTTVTFDTATSFNVASVTRTGVGTYTIAFTSNLATDTYLIVGNATQSSSAQHLVPSGRSVSGFTLTTTNGSGSAAQETNICSFEVILP
jgi:hypothetical protein